MIYLLLDKNTNKSIYCRAVIHMLLDYTLPQHCIVLPWYICCWAILCHFITLYNRDISSAALYSAILLHYTTVIYLLLDLLFHIWTIISPFIALYNLNIFSAWLYSATWLHGTPVIYLLPDYILSHHFIEQPKYICCWTILWHFNALYNYDISAVGLYYAT